MPEVEVHSELRVPFAPDPFNTEAWLRAERPGLRRLAALVDAQPAQYRPQLRRLLRNAAEAIVESGPDGSLEDREAFNHATHLLEDQEETGVFTAKDVVPVDPDAEKDAQIAQALAAAEAAEAEVARLQALLATTPTGDPADGDAGVAEAAVVAEPEPEPEPTEAEVAASAAILDEALEDEDEDEDD